MFSVSNLSVQFGKRVLFDDVNTKFVQGNCYGIIGANGAGKSTFLKILSGEQDPTSGQVHLEKGKRMSVLSQNHFAFDEIPVLEVVISGNKELAAIKKEMDALYADYTDENADKIGELQLIFDEMNHVLKKSPKDFLGQLATYSNPELPLYDGLVDSIVKFLNETK